MNIFIDCGTHLFQGFEQISEKHSIGSGWKCFAFEANPFSYEMAMDKYRELSEKIDIDFINAAVYVKDGYQLMNCVTDDLENTSQRSNLIMSGHQSDFLHKGAAKINMVEVRTIDFSNFIKDNVSEGDFVIVKMDIEGSEFYVLPKLIEDNTYRLIDYFYCEFHERFFNLSDAGKLKYNLIDTFLAAGIQVEEWN